MARKILTTMALVITLVLSVSCIAGSTPSPSPTVTYSPYQLEYKLLAEYPDYFWCDPHLWPIVREGEEEKDSLEEFPAIRANEAEFAAILEHLGLPDRADYTDTEKLSIYREHKKLTRAVQIESSGSIYNFTLSVGEGNGFRIEGTITTSGKIRETKRENAINTCPICLTKGTLIDTPNGSVPVEQIRQGMPVWTLDDSGMKVIATVLATASTPVPPYFQVVKITLDDGRIVATSPGHPSSTGKSLGDYESGDILDGAEVTAVERVNYGGGYTYDILPSGTTGQYWANGILLGSTLFSP